MADLNAVLEAGASITIRKLDAHVRYGSYRYGIAVEIYGLRHGVGSMTLEDGFAQVMEWISVVDFYHGTQWTADQLSRATH